MEFWFVGIYKDDVLEKEKVDLLLEMLFFKYLDFYFYVICFYGCVIIEGEFEVVVFLLLMLFVEVLLGCMSFVLLLCCFCMYMC